MSIIQDDLPEPDDDLRRFKAEELDFEASGKSPSELYLPRPASG